MAKGKLFQSANRVIYQDDDGLRWDSTKTEKSYKADDIQYYIQNAGAGILVIGIDRNEILLNTQTYNPALENSSLADEAGVTYPDIDALVAVITAFKRASGGGGGSVDSVFTRSGDVTAQFGDYQGNQIHAPVATRRRSHRVFSSKKLRHQSTC